MLNTGLERYLSAEARERLAAAHVGIAGAGGLGSNCAMLLVRSGIKRLIIVDFDVIEPSNLNRQYYFPEDVGRPKVTALGEHLLHISPDLDLTLVNKRLTAENLEAVFKNAEIVVEALDNPEHKAVLCNTLLGGPFIVSASGLCGLGGSAMQKRKIGKKMICVGDFESALSDSAPPLAPRVMQAAALEADAVLEFILNEDLPKTD